MDLEVRLGEICEVIGGGEASDGEVEVGEELWEGELAGREARGGHVIGGDASAGAGLGDNVICSSSSSTSPLCIISTMNLSSSIYILRACLSASDPTISPHILVSWLSWGQRLIPHWVFQKKINTFFF